MMKRSAKLTIVARIVLFAVSFIWGTTFVAISSTNNFFQPAFLVFLRCLVGSLALALIFIKRFKHFSLQYVIIGSILGGIMTSGYVMQGIAMTSFHCPPGRCGFLVGTYCVLTPFLSWIFDSKKPHIYNIVAAVLCLAGILCISFPDMMNDSAIALNLGDVFALLSSLVFAVYLVYMERHMPTVDPILFSISNLFFGALYVGIYSFFFEDNAQTVWNLRSIGTLLYLGLICMGLTNLLQAFAQKYVSASTASLIFSLESVFGIMFAIVFWHEQVSAMMLIGCLLVFFAIVLSETRLSFLKIPLHKHAGIRKIN